MTSWQERRMARAEGSLAAARIWAKRGLDPDVPTDVFSIIEDERIWLMFQPLRNLFGFYARDGDADDATAGIVIHNGHPLSVQRFTAAHEYGHHVLKHRASVDREQEVYGRDQPPHELAAQSFAADFLMPVSMVIRGLKRLGLPETPEHLDPVQAYQLSLELGASYTATVTQLANVKRISWRHADELREFKPIDLKTRVAGGTRPASPRSDVWQLDDYARGRRLAMQPDDELHVRLPELPSGGYRWQVETSSELDVLELLDDRLEPLQEDGYPLFGSARVRHLQWRASEAGKRSMTFTLRRAWEAADARPLDSFTAVINVERRRAGELDRGVSWRQRQLAA